MFILPTTRCWLLLLLLMSPRLFALPYQDVNHLTSGQPITPFLHYVVDADGSKHIQDEAQFAWQPVNNDASFGYTSEVYWFKINLINPSDSAVSAVLDILYSVLDDVKIYHRHPDEGWQMQQFGDKYPFAQRSIANRHFLYPLHFQEQSQQQLIFRVKTSSAMQVPIVYWEKNDFFNNEQIDLIASGLFYGTLLTVALCNLFLAISLRDRHFLYYALYISSIGLFFASLQGLSFQYLWPNATEWNDKSIVITLGISIIFGNLFASTFLRLEKYKLINLPLMTLSVITLIIIALSHSLPYEILIKNLLTLSIMTLSLILFSGIYRWHKGFLPARYFVIAWSVHILGGLFMSLNKFNAIPLNFFTENTLPIGVALEALLLSFALADRFIQDKKNHATLQKIALEMERKALLTQQQAATLLEQRVNDRTQELKAANEKLAQLSITDPLTGLNNRRFFDSALEQEHARAIRQHHLYSLMIIDVDFFKKINDQYGHLIGDEVLKALAGLLRQIITRRTDTLARYGGEEFVLILPDTDTEGALLLAERIRQQACNLSLHHLHPDLTLQVSIGLYSGYPTPSTQAAAWVERADNALYQAKNNGRNQVVLYQSHIEL